MSEVASALQKLASYRSHNTRASQEILKEGLFILKNNAVAKMGEDDGWAFLEQLALAAIDVGRLDVADRCLEQLTQKFPGSPRVDCLEGIRIEATESPETALAFYGQLLDANPTNAAIWKRLISVLRRIGKVEKAVSELSEFLDVFYTDAEGWLELADMYTSCNQYAYALHSLSHVMLLNPQNPFYILQFAETAYTAEDIPLSVKMFLVVIEMTGGDAPKSAPTGITLRAWFGVQLCIRRLNKEPRLSSSSPSQTAAPKNIKVLETLAGERLKDAYSSSAHGKDTVLDWVAAR